jgi:hypothetical protein
VQQQCGGRPLLLLSSLSVCCLLLHSLDDAYSDCLTHVTHSEAAQRWVLIEGLNAQRLRWLKCDHCCVTVLDELGVLLKHLIAVTVTVYIQCMYACVSLADLSKVVVVASALLNVNHTSYAAIS